VNRWNRTLFALVIGSIALSNATLIRISAQVVDPCASAAALALPATSVQHTAPGHAKADHDGHQPPTYLDALWAHRARRAGASANSASAAGVTYDAGEIAVLEDAGDLLLRPNPFDLRDSGLRLSPNAAGGYDVSRITYAFRRPLGSAITLGDDDSLQDSLRFDFPFFARSYDHVFVNSDGNLTFGEADTETSERSVTRLLDGPPRIATLFADLDPASGGRVLVTSGVSAYTVTWCAVPEYGSRRRATTQVTLLSEGVIEIQSSSLTTIEEAIVAVSPGHTSAITPVDLSSAHSTGDAGAAVGERFTARSELDTIAATRRFLGVHPDDFDNVVFFTDSEILTDGFAYELTIANDIEGINLDAFDAASDWGSGGRLQSLVMMDALGKYPDNPHEVFLGTNSTLSILGQEFGHRWLSFFTFRDANGRLSQELLGRDAAHWSFFMDSDASVVEGNDIEEVSPGSFRTVGATARYSKLDQYAMGLLDQSEVPPFFYVQNPANVSPPRTARSAPEVGVTFQGTRREVTIDAIIAAAGVRNPSAAMSKRDYTQAFIYVTSRGRTVPIAELEKVDRIRIAWEQFLSAATGSRMRVDTRLQ
jgi:hypothetical protein